MNTICIHIDETLDTDEIEDVKDEIMHVPHVVNVEMNPRVPHDMTVEFEEHHNMPMIILSRLSEHGLHSDVMPC
jgi:hypothetical protein